MASWTGHLRPMNYMIWDKGTVLLSQLYAQTKRPLLYKASAFFFGIATAAYRRLYRAGLDLWLLYEISLPVDVYIHEYRTTETGYL